MCNESINVSKMNDLDISSKNRKKFEFRFSNNKLWSIINQGIHKR